ncbi:hypothetical protein DL93DRAFT_1221992 [Clavulina sp. PMI_390]|nr:hypothetical protein DL93DRAFT_1221992 [Clavulina sp. PMI_390]
MPKSCHCSSSLTMAQSPIPYSPQSGMSSTLSKTTVATPSHSALAVGFLIAVMIMGVVTVQATTYSSRSFSNQRTSVIIVSIPHRWFVGFSLTQLLR